MYNLIMSLSYLIFLIVPIIMLIIVIQGIRKQKKKMDKVNSNITKEDESKFGNIVSKNFDSSGLKGDKTIFTIGCLCLFLGMFISIFFVVAIILFIIYAAKHQKFHSAYKNQVITNFLKQYNPNFKYNPISGISRSDYVNAGFETSFDIFKSEDYISGDFNGVPFVFSEVTVQDEHTDSDGDTSITTLFKGSVVIARLSKNIKNVIHVVENNNYYNKDLRVTIDNAAFEKNFDVFSSDNILAMRILTPDFSSKLLDLKEKNGITFEFKICYDILYIRFDSGNLFEMDGTDNEELTKTLLQNKVILDAIGMVITCINNNIQALDF